MTSSTSTPDKTGSVPAEDLRVTKRLGVLALLSFLAWPLVFVAFVMSALSQVGDGVDTNPPAWMPDCAAFAPPMIAMFLMGAAAAKPGSRTRQVAVGLATLCAIAGGIGLMAF